MTKSTRNSTEVLDDHRRAGASFGVRGIQSFVRSEGEGPPVVCLHGMLGSSFLYRKVLHELALRGFRGAAFDFPGFGLADRPKDNDYSWTGLGKFCVDATDALGLDRFHLVVHDIGGPVGFELAATHPERIASLTLLNTVVDVDGWRPPWTMRPFRRPGIGELWAAGMTPQAFRYLMGRQGVADRSKTSDPELNAYLALMKGEDRARSFLKVSRGAETTSAKQALYRKVVGSNSYPVQVVWSDDDPAMPVATYGERARVAAGLSSVDRIPGKHFPQEDQARAVAERIATFATRA